MEQKSEEESKERSLHDPRAVRDRFQRKVYQMMIQVGFIFGIPAFLAYQVGKVLERKYKTEGAAFFIAFASAFLFSWIIVAMKYRQMRKEARMFDAAYHEIRRERNKSKIQFQKGKKEEN